MLYRKMPKTGEELSILGYGCMRFPTKAGSIDKEKALTQIRSAIDRGVNYLDTAYVYHMGASESFLGDFVLTDGYREKVNIATKLPPFMVNKPRDMEKILDRQRAKLRVEQIDYYMLHGIEITSWKKFLRLGVIEFMERMKSCGKARNMGFSFHGAREDFFEIIDGYDWDFCQVQFNILDENFQAGLAGIRYAAERNIGVIVMEPLRGGQLAGKAPKVIENIWDEAPAKRSAAEWALRWVWNHPEVQVVLSGMSAQEQVDENIRVASDSLPASLSAEELAVIDKARAAYHDLLHIGCTGCRYCMPCPAGIDIPYAFQTYNEFRMFGSFASKMKYAAVTGIYAESPKWTRACIDCGRCEKACPQGLEVRKEFLAVRKYLEGPGIRLIAALARPIIHRRRRGTEG